MHAFREASEQLEQYALEFIEQEYGVAGKSPRPYHNVEHTSSAARSARLLANAIGLSQRDSLLLTIAAAFHDFVHRGDSDLDNERLSADEADKKMREYPVFTDTDIDRVRRMILATHCTAKYPKIVQSPTEEDVLAKILCDADLSSFGKPYEEFMKSSDYYFKELYPGVDKDSVQYKKYLEAEIVILGNHEFWTTEASDMFPHSAKNIQKLQKVVSAF